MKELTLIAALANDRVIGEGNNIPWQRIPEDLKRFRSLTLNHPVLMGRKTYESIGKPLKDRTNIVISRREDFRPEGVILCSSVDDAIQRGFSLSDEVYVIGGQDIYEQTLIRANKLEITQVHGNYPGDRFFPSFNFRDWGLTWRERHLGNPAYTFERYERR